MTIHRFTAHGTSYQLSVTNQPQISKAARRGHPYEHALLEHIYDQHFTGTAVDVGANIGNHTLWFTKVCGLRVEAFEPVFHRSLHSNLVINQITNDQVRVHSTALGSRDAYALHEGPHGKLALVGPATPGTLIVRRLDDYDLTDISMIKIDVEGMEPSVLMGAEQTIYRDRPVIYAEAWDDEHNRKIADVLEPWGYRLTRLFDKPEAWTPMGEWRYAD